MQASDTRGVRWFLATDDTALRNRLTKLNDTASKLIFHATEISRASLHGVQDAVVDFWLLGMADEIIISPYSTFGYISHSRTDKIPHIVNRHLRCVKLLSNQPCTQYWFGMTLSPCFEKKAMLTTDMINQEECWNG